MERARTLLRPRPVSEVPPVRHVQPGPGVPRSDGELEETRPAVEPVYKEPTFLRLMAGFIYFYFGFLKFFKDLSPAELLASEAITRVSDHHLDASTSLFLLAILEVSIGLSLIFKFQLRWMFYAFLFHQFSTFLPLFILPELTFKIAPFAPTMEGQYIIKNLVSLAAGLTVMLPAVRAETARRSAARALRKDEDRRPVLRLQR